MGRVGHRVAACPLARLSGEAPSRRSTTAGTVSWTTAVAARERNPARLRAPGAGGTSTGNRLVRIAPATAKQGLDRHRADTAGQALIPVPGLASTTAAGLARTF